MEQIVVSTPDTKIETPVVLAPAPIVKTSKWTWGSTFKAIGVFAVGVAVGVGAAVLCGGGDESAE